MIGAGAVVDNDAFGRGTVLEVSGANAKIYFADQEETPQGPRRNVQLARVSLVEESADQRDTGYPLYSVYVIELRDTAPAGSPSPKGKPDLYVGISRNTPSARFTTHKTGGRTPSKIVREAGLFLRPGLYRDYGRVSDKVAAADLEQRVSADLREQGHVVYSGAAGSPSHHLKRN
jgi:hypothetical protein